MLLNLTLRLMLAVVPSQVWSWNITKPKGPAKWTCFHPYVILDIFSRYVVGWLVAPRESAELAEQLGTCQPVLSQFCKN
jgi:transposase InsO family protein